MEENFLLQSKSVNFKEQDGKGNERKHVIPLCTWFGFVI